MAGREIRTDTHHCMAAPPALRRELVAAVNNERVSVGLLPVLESAQLSIAAQQHACDMAARGRLSHVGSDGSSAMTRVQKTSYSACLVAENIAAGQRSAPAVMRAWMTSVGHRANILHRGVQHIGLGHAVSENGGDYWVQVLARPC